jgi:hypothetical protein
MAFENMQFTISQRADYDTGHCLVVAKIRERLAVKNKQYRSLMRKDPISGR